jgi:hypothetical protein
MRWRCSRALGLGLPQVWDFASVDPPLGEDMPAEPPRIMAIGQLPRRHSRQIFSWNWVPDYPEYEEEVKVIGKFRSRHHLDALVLTSPTTAHTWSPRSMVDGVRHREEVFSGNTTAFVRELQAFAASIGAGTTPRSCAMPTGHCWTCAACRPWPRPRVDMAGLARGR